MADKVSRITRQNTGRLILMKLVHVVVQVGHEFTIPQPVARLHQATHHCLPMQTSAVLREPPKHSPPGRRSWRLPLEGLGEERLGGDQEVMLPRAHPAEPVLVVAQLLHMCRKVFCSVS